MRKTKKIQVRKIEYYNVSIPKQDKFKSSFLKKKIVSVKHPYVAKVLNKDILHIFINFWDVIFSKQVIILRKSHYH